MKKHTKAKPIEKEERSHQDRKSVIEVDVLEVKNVESGEVYFARAAIVDVSASGVLLRVKREHIIDEKLRSHLTLSGIHASNVSFTINVMDTYIEGIVTRSHTEGKGEFVVAVDFRHDAPEYWRQCLFDLLPDSSDDLK